MASMTPQRPSKKGRLSSPLGEMDDGLEELEGTAAETPAQLTPTALADIVRQEIQRGLDPLDAKITTLQSTVEGRLDSVEAELLSHHSKIEKMEKLLDSMDGATPHSCASDKSLQFEQKLAEPWCEDWLKWAEFQNSPELQQLHDRSTGILTKRAKGAGKSRSKRDEAPAS